ncbi:MAG TPA: glycosyltransferase family 4 protein [Roseiflexaceae bacterium]|nr:glycosyltransferase family 4 protein [Roseiflexaceae bacterium]
MRTSPYRLAIVNSHPIQYFAPLYRRIAQEPGIDLTVYYCSREGVDEYVDPGFGQRIKWDISLLDGYRYQFLPNWRQGNRPGGIASMVNPAIAAEIWRHRYDAIWVHGHNCLTHLLAIAAAKLTGTLVMMSCDTTLLRQRKLLKRILRQPLMTIFYIACDACLAVGTRNAQYYRRHGVSERKLFRVPYSVDNDFFISSAERYRKDVDATKRELGIATDRPVILYASKLVRRKRPMDLLQAYHRLIAQRIEATLLFVGSGAEEEELRAYSAHHELRDVHFLGFRNQTVLPLFYALADIFVLPSVDEPWGLVINEVMCASLPVIATDVVGAAADLVRHSENGFLFRPGDLGELSSYLAQLCSDRGMCRKMGARSLEIIRGWSYEQCVEGLSAAMRIQIRPRAPMPPL